MTSLLLNGRRSKEEGDEEGDESEREVDEEDAREDDEKAAILDVFPISLSQNKMKSCELY